MIPYRCVLLLLIPGLVVLFGGCVNENRGGSGSHGSEKSSQQSDAVEVNSGIVEFIKGQMLGNFSARTIGDAFDNYKYVSKIKWTVTPLQEKHIAVDYIGWFDSNTLTDKDRAEGITERGITVTFVIQPDGRFYVFTMTKLESKSDGKTYRSELNDTTSVLKKIYANEKIPF